MALVGATEVLNRFAIEPPDPADFDALEPAPTNHGVDRNRSHVEIARYFGNRHHDGRDVAGLHKPRAGRLLPATRPLLASREKGETLTASKETVLRSSGTSQNKR